MIKGATDKVQGEAKLRYALFPFDLGDVTYLAKNLSLDQLKREIEVAEQKLETDTAQGYYYRFKLACELAAAHKETYPE